MKSLIMILLLTGGIICYLFIQPKKSVGTRKLSSLQIPAPNLTQNQFYSSMAAIEKEINLKGSDYVHHKFYWISDLSKPLSDTRDNNIPFEKSIPKASFDERLKLKQARHLVSTSTSTSKSEYSVLFIHGLFGSAYQLASKFLVSGYTMAGAPFGRYLPGIAITLDGHGVFGENFKKVSYQNWVKQVENGLKRAKELGEKVIVVGQSTGGALAAYLAKKYPKDIHGTVLIEPAFKVHPRLKHLVCLTKYVFGDIRNTLIIREFANLILGEKVQDFPSPIAPHLGCEVHRMSKALFPEIKIKYRHINFGSRHNRGKKRRKVKKEYILKKNTKLHELPNIIPTLFIYTNTDRVVDPRAMDVVLKEFKDASQFQLIDSLKFNTFDRKYNSHGMGEQLLSWIDFPDKDLINWAIRDRPVILTTEQTSRFSTAIYNSEGVEILKNIVDVVENLFGTSKAKETYLHFINSKNITEEGLHKQLGSLIDIHIKTLIKSIYFNTGQWKEKEILSLIKMIKNHLGNSDQEHKFSFIKFFKAWDKNKLPWSEPRIEKATLDIFESLLKSESDESNFKNRVTRHEVLIGMNIDPSKRPTLLVYKMVEKFIKHFNNSKFNSSQGCNYFRRTLLSVEIEKDFEPIFKRNHKTLQNIAHKDSDCVEAYFNLSHKVYGEEFYKNYVSNDLLFSDKPNISEAAIDFFLWLSRYKFLENPSEENKGLLTRLLRHGCQMKRPSSRLMELLSLNIYNNLGLADEIWSCHNPNRFFEAFDNFKVAINQSHEENFKRRISAELFAIKGSWLYQRSIVNLLSFEDLSFLNGDEVRNLILQKTQLPFEEPNDQEGSTKASNNKEVIAASFALIMRVDGENHRDLSDHFNNLLKLPEDIVRKFIGTLDLKTSNFDDVKKFLLKNVDSPHYGLNILDLMRDKFQVLDRHWITRLREVQSSPSTQNKIRLEIEEILK